MRQIDWELLGHLQFSRFVPHAVGLTHSRLESARFEVRNERVAGDEDIVVLLMKQDQLTMAECIFQRVVISKEALGPDHTSTHDNAYLYW